MTSAQYPASQSCVNSLPNDKILALSKLKAFANDKFNVTKMMISVSYWVENIVGKGENAGNQHFLLFPQCFQKASAFGLLKGVCGKESNILFVRTWLMYLYFEQWI